MSKVSSTPDPSIELRDAIRKLEAFSRHTSEGTDSSQISKTIALMRTLLRHAFVETQKEGVPHPDEVLKAIEVVNSKRLFLLKLQKGSPAEQEVADSYTKAIENFNRTREEQLKASKNSGLAKLFTHAQNASANLPKIDLPEQHTVKYLYPPADGAAVPAGRENKHTLSAVIAISKQSMELFQMKVLALLERYGIASSHEIRMLVKQAPIETEMTSNASTCTLKQTLTLFPGQTVVVMGNSVLDPKTQTISKLFPETFSVSLESTQTGFPHPSQRAGWALACQLLPECPQRIDLLAHVGGIFQRKKSIVPALMPNGKLVVKAKKLLKLKKQVFAHHSQELLNLHKNWARVFIQAAPATWVLPNSEQIVSRFYEGLDTDSQAFDKLSSVHQNIRDQFITKLHQTLLDSIIKGKGTGFSSQRPSLRYQTTKTFLEQVLENSLLEIDQQKKVSSEAERLKLDYIDCIGRLQGRAAIAIILQYLSEDLIYEPPLLSLFESQMQAATFHQLTDFLEELALPEESLTAENIHKLLVSQISADTAIFQSAAPFAASAEMAAYFHKRYASLSIV